MKYRRQEGPINAFDISPPATSRNSQSPNQKKTEREVDLPIYNDKDAPLASGSKSSGSKWEEKPEAILAEMIG